MIHMFIFVYEAISTYLFHMFQCCFVWFQHRALQPGENNDICKKYHCLTTDNCI